MVAVEAIRFAVRAIDFIEDISGRELTWSNPSRCQKSILIESSLSAGRGGDAKGGVAEMAVAATSRLGVAWEDKEGKFPEVDGRCAVIIYHL